MPVCATNIAVPIEHLQKNYVKFFLNFVIYLFISFWSMNYTENPCVWRRREISNVVCLNYIHTCVYRTSLKSNCLFKISTLLTQYAISDKDTVLLSFLHFMMAGKPSCIMLSPRIFLMLICAV